MSIVGTGAATWRTTPRSTDVVEVRRLAVATGYFRPDEVDVAVELVEESLQRGDVSGYRFIFADGEEALPHDQASLCHPMETSTALRRAGTSLRGYVCFGEIPCTSGSYDLYWIIVDPREQGRGHGRALLRAAETAIVALGGRQVFIETSSLPLYEPTRRFYLSSGYRLAARFEDFYREGDDKLVYVRRLEQQGPGAAS